MSVKTRLQDLERRTDMRQDPGPVFLEVIYGCSPPPECRAAILERAERPGSGPYVVELTDTEGHCLSCGLIHEPEGDGLKLV